MIKNFGWKCAAVIVIGGILAAGPSGSIVGMLVVIAYILNNLGKYRHE